MSGHFLKNILFTLFLLLPTTVYAADNAAITKTLEALTDGELTAGKPVTGTIIIRDIASGDAVTLDSLISRNKRRIHLWLVDPTFTDIQHLHPETSITPYTFNFTFIPKITSSYMAWADITTHATNKQELLVGWLGEKDAAFIERIESHTKAMNGHNFTLSFDVPPQVGQTSIVNLNVTDHQKKPVKWSIEAMAKQYSPVEYFSLIGFYDDNTHAIAAMQETDTYFYGPTYGPDVKFKITPTQAGYVKMFAHVTISGKEMFVPFGVMIQK
ncbi:MAG: hypothetical protein AABY33_06125 [Pseudomonadota bacterium]